MTVFIANFLQFINWLLGAYMWILIASAVISWVRPDPANPIVRFLYAVTEPVLWRIRRVIPTNFGGVDLSPLLVILAILFLQNVVIGGLISMILGQTVVLR
ncbi:MAG: YggT family protein [Desulfarculus sp.]|nr:MAG: YggT family protein [Desulfarculus sp.]